jgi:hypothetical protein
MLRVNYLHPKQMPPHQRHFPRRPQLDELPRASSLRGLALMVAWYLVAMFAGILLLGYLTAPLAPNTTTATRGVTLNK